MTEATRTEPALSGFSRVLAARHDPAARILIVDWLTLLIVILFATGIVGALLQPPRE